MAINISFDDLENEEIFNKVVNHINKPREERNDSETQVEIEKIKAKEPIEIKIYDCNDCKYMTVKEGNQSENKEPHMCSKYDTRIYHLGRHPRLIPIDECEYKASDLVSIILKNKV
jgi:hypothetical protein